MTGEKRGTDVPLVGIYNGFGMFEGKQCVICAVIIFKGMCLRCLYSDAVCASGQCISPLWKFFFFFLLLV